MRSKYANNTYIFADAGKYTRGGDIMTKKKKAEDREHISTDPFGSYTGKPVDPFERPIQDADDL